MTSIKTTSLRGGFNEGHNICSFTESKRIILKILSKSAITCGSIYSYKMMVLIIFIIISGGNFSTLLLVITHTLIIPEIRDLETAEFNVWSWIK